MIIGQLFIDGAWMHARARAQLPVFNPATEEILASVAAADSSDVEAAVAAARRAFDSGAWPRSRGRERARILRATAAGIRGHLEELAVLEVQDNGKPLREARCDIDDAATCFEFYADFAVQEDTRPAEVLRLPDERFSSRVVREPVGVVAAIIPWNYPLLMAAWKVAPALAAGCTIVLKPSELTPLTALQLATIAQEAGLPPGALNVITGLGQDAGAALAQHPGIDKLAFTGSVATGSTVMESAARDIKRVSLELGGKSPLLVFADCDVEQALEWLMMGIFWNQGQVCSATSRVLIERSLYGELTQRVAEEAGRIPLGNGLDPGVLLGPLVSSGQCEKVRAAIDRGVREGARLIAGGSRPPAGRDRGYFVSPTVFADVSVDTSIWTEEVFGPVVCLAAFDTEEEAIRLANDSSYGLAAAVISRDRERCNRVAARLCAGIVWINCSQPTFVQAPWGGRKHSGLGRELGRWGFESYLELKQITQYDSRQRWGGYLNRGG